MKHCNTDPIVERVRAAPWEGKQAPLHSTCVVEMGVPNVNVLLEPLATDPVERKKQLREQGSFLSADAVEELARCEDAVFRRIAANPELAVRSITDPLSVLRELQAELSPHVLAELTALRQKVITPDVLRALTEVKNLSVEVRSK